MFNLRKAAAALAVVGLLGQGAVTMAATPAAAPAPAKAPVAAQQQVQAKVVAVVGLEVTLKADGTVKSVKVIQSSGNKELDQYVVQNFEKQKFQNNSGKEVTGQVAVQILQKA